MTRRGTDARKGKKGPGESSKRLEGTPGVSLKVIMHYRRHTSVAFSFAERLMFLWVSTARFPLLAWVSLKPHTFIRWCDYPRRRDQEAEAQDSLVTCPRTQEGVELGFISGLPALKSTIPYTLEILKYHIQNLFFPQKKISLERRGREGRREAEQAGGLAGTRGGWHSSELRAHDTKCTCSPGNRFTRATTTFTFTYWGTQGPQRKLG